MHETTQLALAIDKPHRNQYLFSDHYLESILRREKVWTDALGPATDFLIWLRGHYAAEMDQLLDYNEAQLEENWIKPILSRLGHVWEPQASVPGMDRQIKKPDYVFFPDDDTRKAAVKEQRTEDYARQALAVGEVKAWPVNLSRKTAGAPTFDNNNPMFQIDYYLKATGAVWGIVSNGRFWRLVHHDSSYRLDRYFEVDLLEALTTADERRALAVATYFTLFFGRAAFARDEAGRVFLGDVLKGSQTYAVALESDLRDNAYKALEQIILGFFAPSTNNLDPNNDDHRDAVYRNSLLLLYRLLFLFYGESRGLLPMGNERYRERSLTELAKRAARIVDNHKVETLPPMTGALWGEFKQLFAIIDGRDAALNAFLGVPRYNGGLFDPQRHEFMESNVVGERYLVRAIDYLARRRKTENGSDRGYESVDYRTLGVRQLGSIYEGLLEYKVSVAAEEMVTVRKGGKETWLPARERGKTKVIETKQAGELYLATDKGERKATGSYYTPDYIVKYIVEQTLGPLVNEARERVKARMRDERARGATADLGLAARLFEQEILALNVLDPAMGSGHFLVDATNYLARALATDEYATAGGDEEADLTYWKRRVVEACIYGVDKNELAVELAKLSLWLETVAADKPLSFLDHHLRHGDSLIGARLADLERAPRPDRSRRPVRSSTGDDLLFDESAFTTSAGLAVGGSARIEAILTDDLDAVHDKERILREIQEEHLARWRRLADLWVSAWFGNDMSAEEYRDLALRIQGKPEGFLSDEQAARYLDHPAATDNDYFHWELEFPEVFFDQFGRPKGEKAGFDAVVGNPPYVRQEHLKEYKAFYAIQFDEVYTGTADLFVYFFMRAINLLLVNGLTSFISSNSWLRANYATALRAYLRQNVILTHLIDLGDNHVFEDAPDMSPAIHVAQKCNPLSNESTLSAIFDRGEGIADLEKQLELKKVYLLISQQRDSGWQLESLKARSVFDKIRAAPYTLGEVTDKRIFFGIKTGLNEAFIVDSVVHKSFVNDHKDEVEILKPLVRGADLRPWYQIKRGNWLISIPNGWTAERYGSNIDESTAWNQFSDEFPSIANHLIQFRDQAKRRQDKGEYWWELRPCAYYDSFERPKIIWPDISKYPRFSTDTTGLYINNTGFIAETDYSWVIAYLMSRCAWYSITNISIPFSERAGLMNYRLFYQYMSPLPVPEIPTYEAEKLSGLAYRLTSNAKARFRLAELTRNRISTDLGIASIRLNDKLNEWWQIDFSSFRDEVRKVFKRDIPVRERTDWEHFLATARQEHESYTAEIVRMETELNAIVYEVFDLNPAEIKIIENSTKYRYGEI